MVCVCQTRRPRGSAEPLQLVVTCEDWDEVSAADFMGQFAVPLAPFCDQKVVRQWYALESQQGKKGDVSGHVELILQWRHDPALAFEPFSHEDTFAAKPPNEQRLQRVCSTERVF